VNSRRSFFYESVVGLLGLVLLVAFSPRWPPAAMSWPLVVFILLSVLVKRAGFYVAPPATHSLVGIVDLAALLLFGPALGGWVAVLSDLIYLELHAVRYHAPDWAYQLADRLELVRPLMAGPVRNPVDASTSYEAFLFTPIFSSGLKGLMALGAGFVYRSLGGAYAPITLSWRDVLPLGGLFVTWFLLDHVAWGLRAYLRNGREGLETFLRRVLIASLLVELLPLPISLVIVAVYAGLGTLIFLLLALALIAAAHTVQRLVKAQHRLRSRIAELTTFETLGRSIVRAQLDVDQLCELVYEYSSRVTDTRTFVLELVDEQREEVRLAILIENGIRHEPRTIPLTGLARWMGQTRRPLLIRDLAREPLPFEGQVIGQPCRSAAFLPMLAGQKLIGVVSIQAPEPWAFDDDTLRTLSSVVNPLAVAIENARLYEREWQRAIQLSTISEVSRQVAAILDLEELFGRVVQLIKGSFGYDHVQIFTINDEGQEAIFRASTGPMSDVWRSRGYRLRVGQEGIIGWVAERGQPLLVNDVTQEPRYIDDPDRMLASTRAELAVPLKVEARVVGVLDVQSNQPRAFGHDDLFILQTLADSVAIAIEDARLYQEALQRERLEEELRVAREIQSSLLPECCPLIPGWDLAVDWRPAREVAGDFYDFVDMPDGRLGLFIADVSDKGVPAALFMAMARSLVRATLLSGRPPAQALERSNLLILTDARANMFVTLFFAALNRQTGELTYVNAGHNPPLVYRARSGSIASLRAGGIALGVIDEIELHEEQITLEPGDLVVLYTDGVTEAINDRYEEFGLERMAQVLFQNAAESAGCLIDRLNEARGKFVGDQPPFDDAALIVVRRKPDRNVSGTLS
jgi:serine phosphatase RsbU (regulator of sigma subunit)